MQAEFVPGTFEASAPYVQRCGAGDTLCEFGFPLLMLGLFIVAGVGAVIACWRDR
jgi:hypothetical protein